MSYYILEVTEGGERHVVRHGLLHLEDATGVALAVSILTGKSYAVHSYNGHFVLQTERGEISTCDERYLLKWDARRRTKRRRGR